MTVREPYSYVVLRYVHDVLTGEFVNVGLVMAVPDRSWLKTRVRKTYGRIKSVFPDLDSDAYKSAMAAVDRGMRQVERVLRSEGLFKDTRTARDYGVIAVPLDDSTLQWSPVGAGLTSDPERTFDHLYERFVTRYDRPVKRNRSDDDVWRLVSSRLKDLEVRIELHPKLITGRTDEVEFRHAWKNGRWHVYEPVSFDLADADGIKDKARHWLGHLTAVKNGATEEPQLHFFVGRPDDAGLVAAYRNAIEILKQIPFDTMVFEEDQLDQLVRRIQDDARSHEQVSQ